MKMENLNSQTREKVISYLHDTGMSVNRFAKETEVLQPNLHVFLNGKGLSIKNLERIWRYLHKKGI